MKNCVKGTKKKEPDEQTYSFELFSFCDSLDVDTVGRAMRIVVEQLQPLWCCVEVRCRYLVLESKPNMGCCDVCCQRTRSCVSSIEMRSFSQDIIQIDRT